MCMCVCVCMPVFCYLRMSHIQRGDGAVRNTLSFLGLIFTAHSVKGDEKISTNGI